MECLRYQVRTFNDFHTCLWADKTLSVAHELLDKIS